tara:strand:+ start:1437 stop:1667 length:231 start_codon:yes stop_codon:yes gene_type:complete
MITGTFRVFTYDDWCDFGDYHSLYREMHQRTLVSRNAYSGSVVNSEFVYYLRDQNQDGISDEQDSATIGEIPTARW